MSDPNRSEPQLRIREQTDHDGVLRLVVADAGRDGWDLEVDPRVSEAVNRVIELADVGSQFWPEAG